MTLSNGKCRSFQAPDVKSLMEWMTAIAVASEALVVNPPSELQLVDHSKTTHIILVRHGHYMAQSNAMADMNASLTPNGIKQARQTGHFLREYLDARGVLKRFPEFPIHHSGVQRSAQTAQIIAEVLKPNTPLLENKLFREAWPGNPLPQTNQKVIAREKLDNMVSDCARLQIIYRTMFRHVIPVDLNSREVQLSEEDVKKFHSLFGSSTQARLNDRYRVIVCHANIIRWFVCKALGVDPDGTWGRMRSNHCSVTAMEVDSVGNVTLGFVNQTGHLGAELMTENN
jgi:serine/threonine-protein phosphatase PGAM5